MSAMRAYDEMIHFIATESPSRVIAFRPSDATRARVAGLVAREKSATLTPEEASELAHYLELEHIMRLAKARAKKVLLAS